jgi:NAD+ diphosphatase
MTDAAIYIVPDCKCRADDSFILFHERQLLIRGNKFLWQKSELLAVGLSGFDCLLLETGERNTLAAMLTAEDAALLSAEPIATREMLMRTGQENFNLIGQGTQLITWYCSHRFCGSCGARTAPHLTQRALICTRCDGCYYPRINPCVIVLVTQGDRVLLARSSRPGARFFSCLAGFMEIGETPEQTVAREVREEAGIEVENIRYIQSQSWPFPSQLMLGFFADYKSGELNPDPEELSEADWFPVLDIPVPVAPSLSVAGQLLENYRRSLNKERGPAGFFTQ